MQRGFFLDKERCINCHACEVACKNVHGIEPGPRWIRVTANWSGRFPNVRRTFIPFMCFHCEEPACIPACPMKAIYKRDEDGIVLVNRDKCDGCKLCLPACPWRNPQFGEDGLMQKCDYCIDRVERGLKPACSATCPTSALHTGTLEELSEQAYKKRAERLVGPTKPSCFL